MSDDARRVLERFLEDLGLSARACDKVLRIARTLADLENMDRIESNHMGEAVQYRSLDRDLF